MTTRGRPHHALREAMHVATFGHPLAGDGGRTCPRTRIVSTPPDAPKARLADGNPATDQLAQGMRAVTRTSEVDPSTPGDFKVPSTMRILLTMAPVVPL